MIGSAAPEGSIATGLARDIALFDQRGCLSIQAIYTAGDAIGLAEALAEELSTAARELPPGPLDPVAVAGVQQIRMEAALRGLYSPELPIDVGTVVVEPRPEFQPSPGLRTVRIHPVEDLAKLPEILAPWSGQVQGAALAGDDAWRLQPAARVSRRQSVRRPRPPSSSRRHLAQRRHPSVRGTDRASPRLALRVEAPSALRRAVFEGLGVEESVVLPAGLWGLAGRQWSTERPGADSQTGREVPLSRIWPHTEALSARGCARRAPPRGTTLAGTLGSGRFKTSCTSALHRLLEHSRPGVPRSAVADPGEPSKAGSTQPSASTPKPSKTSRRNAGCLNPGRVGGQLCPLTKRLLIASSGTRQPLPEMRPASLPSTNTTPVGTASMPIRPASLSPAMPGGRP